MATITATGLASGLDVESIVTQLMELERLPLERLQTQESQVEAQISAYGQYKSALSEFQTAMDQLSSISKFKIYNATSSDENLMSATATESAAPGRYDINVSALASHHKLASGAYANSTDAVGTGTIDISVGAESFSVTIDSENNSLAGIRDAINQNADNTGVTATLLKDDAGSRLIFTSDESGTEQALSVSASGSAGLTGLVNTTEVSAAADAELTIDGFNITSGSNTISTALQGVNLELKDLGSSTLSLTRNNEAIAESVQSFADAYNALQSTTTQLRSGQLAADSTLLTIQSSIQSVINTKADLGDDSPYSYMTEVGLSTGKDGNMTVDLIALEKAMDTDFHSFTSVFADSEAGFAVRLDTLMDGFLGIDGLIESREDGFDSRIRRIQDQEASYEYRLELTETRLRSQFTALEELMAGFNSTSSFLTQQLANQSS